jgi:hypothetical protein
MMTDQTFEVRGAAVISSIGSIPQPIDGIDMKGELYDFSDWTYGRMARYPSVFSAGNVVTGKGNIVASRKHATQVSQEAIETYLGVGEDAADRSSGIAEAAAELAADVADHAEALPPLSERALAALEARLRARQEAVGYTGEITTWLQKIGAPS